MKAIWRQQNWPDPKPVLILHAIKAGTLYAITVFGIGFVLGAIRVLLVSPHFGATLAVALEAPLMLIASWYVCRWSVRWARVPRRFMARWTMGIDAFAVLMLAEYGLGVLVFHRAPGEQLVTYATVTGVIGLAAQVIFGLFPVIQVWRK